jgi:hypothetical protein
MSTLELARVSESSDVMREAVREALRSPVRMSSALIVEVRYRVSGTRDMLIAPERSWLARS